MEGGEGEGGEWKGERVWERGRGVEIEVAEKGENRAREGEACQRSRGEGE